MLRTTKDGVEVSTTTFRSPRDNRRIVLMSTLHWGVASYWRQCQMAMESFPGFVLREGTVGVSAEEEKRRWEEVAWQWKVEFGLTPYELMEVFCNARYQLELLRDTPRTIVSDVDRETRRRAIANMGSEEESDDKIYIEMARILLGNQEVLTPIFGYLWQHVYRLSPPQSPLWHNLISELEFLPDSLFRESSSTPRRILEELGAMFFHENSERRDFTVGHREQVFWSYIREYKEKDDLLLFYGLAHYPGIARRLWNHGYRIESRDWLLALPCRHISRQEFFKAMIDLSKRIK